MTTIQARREGSIWWTLAGWAAANLVGWGAGFLLMAALGWGIAERLDGALGDVGAALLGWLIGGLAGGALAGALQAAVLRGYGVSLGGWVAATAAGTGIGLAALITVLVLLNINGPHPLTSVLVALAGCGVAAAQWLVLRRALPNAWIWLPSGLLGFVALLMSALALGGEGRELIASLGSAAAYAVVTGAGLAALLGRAAR